MAAAPAFVGTPKLGLVQLLNASGTGKVTVYTAGASGSKITGVNAASNDNTIRVLSLWVTRAGTSYFVMTTAIPISAGGDTTSGLINAVNMLAGALGLPVDNDGQKYLFLESGDTLQVSSAVAVTAGKEIDIVAVGGNL